MRIRPVSSSMSTSACTVGPYFFCRAARMPSCSSSYSSVRRAASRSSARGIAVRISAEATIQDSFTRVPVERQPGLADLGERQAVLGALRRARPRPPPGLALERDDRHLGLPGRERRGRDHRRLPGEPLPVPAPRAGARSRATRPPARTARRRARPPRAASRRPRHARAVVDARPRAVARSIRRSSTGRLLLPRRRSSTSSKPRASSSVVTTCSSSSFTADGRSRTATKNVGGPPHIRRRGPGAATMN
jgi:hypothetical protein